MKMKFIMIFLCVSMMGMTAVLSSANAATILTSKINMDNGFMAYISTSDTVAGTPFSGGIDWTTTIPGNTPLTAGTDYFLHVWGHDFNDGYPWAGFLGEFSLSGTDHIFDNGTTSLLTNTGDWVASATGWGPYTATMLDFGANGVGPWGAIGGVSGAAHWIWADNQDTTNDVYFSTEIAYVRDGVQEPIPEPATVMLMGIGLVGLAGGAARRKFKKKEVDKS